MNKDKNLKDLVQFVNEHHLRKENESIHFKGRVTLDTTSNKFRNEQLNINIDFKFFEYYGTLSVSNLYDYDKTMPLSFETNRHLFEYIDNVYLKITGFKNKEDNKEEFVIKIVPLY